MTPNQRIYFEEKRTLDMPWGYYQVDAVYMCTLAMYLVQFGNSVNFGCKIVFNFGLKLVPFFVKNVFSDVNNQCR